MTINVTAGADPAALELGFAGLVSVAGYHADRLERALDPTDGGRADYRFQVDVTGGTLGSGDAR